MYMYFIFIIPFTHRLSLAGVLLRDRNMGPCGVSV